MIANIIYIVVATILIFVLYLAVKAITRGVEAKSELRELSKEKEESSSEKNDIDEKLLKLKKMYDDGILTEDEFKKAKEKILS
tara:strand:+ start:349 stop:597 length:249 start_codon:yes stop_codon:yes gene_type:complete